MGVPSFYRWLVKKYPKVVVDAIDEAKGDYSIDSSLPNPNGIEFDNLYLDMNCIIHPCFHPDDDHHPNHDGLSAAPTTFEDVFNNIFEYIDQLFSIVRPRKLLYMAIDGVAPRAKMNQQRARRFRTAKDKEIYEAEEMKLRKQFEMEGKQVLPKQESETSDSNIITPGTEFMHELSKALQRYISLRLSTDLGWKDIKVILSDANVPGEGEHKIMSFIRRQRQLPTYNPNTHHCLYGSDADLIMLALATHEIHFSILREDLLNHDQIHHSSKSVSKASISSVVKCKQPHQFLHIWILREYLELDMQICDPPKDLKLDVERLINDFIFMCFFVGNDFLPHMPTLEIHEGAIDLLMTVYKKEFKSFGGYLVDMGRILDKKAGYIKLSRVEKFILSVGAYEEKIFMKRSDLRERKLRNLCNNSNNLEEEEDSIGSLLSAAIASVENVPSTSRTLNNQCSYSEVLDSTKEFKSKIKEILKRKSDLFYNGSFGTNSVKLSSPGFKQRYYKMKFSAQSPEEVEHTRKILVKKYTEGLLWVLLYYFSSPPSWTWFYPFHYGPFTSDLKGLSQVKMKFEKGSPFKPFDQLMAVLPPRSANALPKAYQPLLLEDSSSIIDFYPNDFEVDEDGQRFSWQGICKLPFIEEERLLSETKKLDKELKEEEKVRNTEQFDRLFVRCTHRLASQTLSLPENSSEGKLDCDLSLEIGGYIHSHQIIMDLEEPHDPKPEQNVLCVLYKLPDCGIQVPHLLDGVKIPDKIITKEDLNDTQLWHEYRGSNPPHRSLNQERFGKANINGNSKFNNTPSSSQNYVLAGSGWSSASRGKPISGQDVSMHKGASLGPEWGAGRGRGKPTHPSRQMNFTGFREFTVSGPSPRSSSSDINGRVHPVNGSFWPSRNGAIQDINHAWQPSFQARGIRPGPATWNPQAGSIYTWKHTYSSVANWPSPASGSHRANSTNTRPHKSGSAANQFRPVNWDQWVGSTYAWQRRSGSTAQPSTEGSGRD
ncbi:5'-3' exoribonuclease 3 [Ziziphus jujuba]|uniref:5'-3' exoribonuclease n=1 Tax=Ziziphus jujuba TaxID=326968 RepID=A0ABM4AFX2_ZIZJJ|nr:5'-3' exoribonuclease 3 [Ziziphus jujuba]XP_048325817.2 5'-3' exoribonuclease 3 [Ziziphus jujuba]XP_060675620.1 5'-3' exoribonuclease 3 [Ziziphus jujuba]